MSTSSFHLKLCFSLSLGFVGFLGVGQNFIVNSGEESSQTVGVSNISANTSNSGSGISLKTGSTFNLSGVTQRDISLKGQVTSGVGGGITCGIEIDFETVGGYTTSEPEFTDGIADYFKRTDGSDISANVSFTNTDGSFFAAQDIDEEGASLPVQLTIENIDISSLANLEFSIDIAEDDDGLNQDWDASDYMRIYYTIDSGTEQNLLWVESELPSGTNGRPLIDTNFDGVGDGAEITDTFTSFTQSISGTGLNMDIRIEFSLDAGDEDIAIDNISVCGVNNNIDADSFVDDPGQIPSGTIIAHQTTLFSSAVPVFKFRVNDPGTSDGAETVVEQFRIVPGSADTTIWSQIIQGVEVVAQGSGGQVFNSDQNVIINDNEIIVQILATPNQEMTTADGDNREYTVGVYLNETGIIDQQIIQFALPSSSADWIVKSNSSQFLSTLTSFEGNPFTIDVVGNGLEFISDASTTIVDQSMNAVQVANTDTNGNIDKSLIDDIEIVSSGTLTGEPVNQTPVNGIAAFPNLIHTVVEDDLVLTASTIQSGVNNSTSLIFDVIALPEIFISEIADPINTQGKFIEIFNSGVTSVDFSSSKYFLVLESNGGPNLSNLQLTGNIEPKGYFIIGASQFNSIYSITGDMIDATPIGGTVSGNGNDTYFLSKDNINEQNLKNSMVEVYGEIGTDGTGETWEYENSRAYRNNPIVKNANTTWTASEWTIQSNANATEMTPGYGDNDYIYDNGTWDNSRVLNFSPDGVNQPTRNIFVKSGTVSFLNNTEIGDLVVRNGATLKLRPGVKLTVTGDIVNEGTIIFESDDTSTAVLEAVQPSTRVVGNGFEIHRRIPVQPEFRAFRYLSSSVNTQNSEKSTIYDNWQEGGAAISGFGTHITGSTTGANGFDATQTGNPSMFSWNTSLQEWAPINNTNADSFAVSDTYAILIRGDRSSPLDTNGQTGPSTTLRTTGKIHAGDFVFTDLATTVNHFSLVGNPYQSQVDLSTLLSSSNPNSQGLDEQFIYIWDPTIGTLGGYATIDIGANTVTQVTAGVPTDSDASKFLQPNQAFFVQSTSNNPSLIFTEDDKDNSIGQTEVFSSEAETTSQLDITLKSLDGRTYDGLKIVYDNVFNNSIDENDATKFWNYTDNLSIHNESNYLSIEKRELPLNQEVTPLYFSSQSLNSYFFEILFSSQNEEFNVFLFDKYTAQTIAIPANTLFSYSFNLDTNLPESMANDRFEIIYNNEILSSVTSSNLDFDIYPNPKNNNESIYLQSTPKNISGIEKIQLFNLNGQIVEDISTSLVHLSPSQAKISFGSELTRGLYFLKIKTKESMSSHKIIIN